MLLSLAAFAVSSCQLFLTLHDCDRESDCRDGRHCDLERHICQVRLPIELCNGVDDNHNNVADVDEDFGPCVVPPAMGTRACRDGVLRCRDSRTIVCEVRVSPEALDSCDNGLDDDCNGIVDDGAECAQNFGATTGLQIGSDDPSEGEGDDAPAHTVCLGPFSIDRHEVNMAAFAVFLSSFDQSTLMIERPTAPLNSTVVYGNYVVLHEAGHTFPLLAVPNAPTALSFDRNAFSWSPHLTASAMLPAVSVTWFGADRYCRWAGKHLPTEAEFTRAARGATGRDPFPWGNAPLTCDRANVGRGGLDGGPCVGAPVTITDLPQGVSAEGVFNLYGNANEWMYDRLNTNPGHTRNLYYESLPADGGAAGSAWCATYPMGPVGPTMGTPIAQPEDAGRYCVDCRFARGRHYRTVDLRIGIRRWLDADRSEPYVGFRCSQGGAVRP